MKKILICILGITTLLVILDLSCITFFNRPLFALKEDNGDSVNIIYRGILYDTYYCHEYPKAKIHLKGVKLTCSPILREDIGKVTYIKDTTKDKNGYSCAEILESFYEDDEYIYFYNCKKSKYVIVKYNSGYEETVKEALKQGTIKISDLDEYEIEYLKEKK